MTARQRTLVRAALALAAAAALAVALAAGWSALQRARLQAHGAALFEGRTALTGRLLGHATALPSDAARCVNCHRAGGAADAAFAPSLEGTTLTTLRARRGGPPSRYDADSFCRLLRTGVDPAWVQIPRDMPRYDLDDGDCHALWAHVVAAAPASSR